MRAKDLEVLNEMPFFFWVKDDEGKYIWVNRALNEMAGQDITLTGEPMFVEEYIQQPGKASLNVCKFVGDYEGKRCAIGVSFVIK
jgi:hypothetical protein